LDEKRERERREKKAERPKQKHRKRIYFEKKDKQKNIL
jgi:hypothetical protein